MKKQRKSNSTSNKNGKTQSAKKTPEDTGRRRFLGLSANAALGLAALAGGGFFVVQHVQGAIHEHDLSRVQNGTPTVVQVHDPQCPLCRALQHETRQALSRFDDGQIDYVIANIRSAEGQEFAEQYDVPHVTLLLFDAAGNHTGTIRGQQQSESLYNAFHGILPE